ncbi:MAG: NAD(P)H-binding protein [Sandaracinaceae bacterium]
MSSLRVVMIGGTGAVGGHAIRTLLSMPALDRLTLLGRREVEGLGDPRVTQHVVDVLDATTYRTHLDGHDAALSTLGVGEPSKVSRERFVQIDRDAPLAFGQACREAGVTRFGSLGSVGSSPTSASFFLRCKGELEAGLEALEFAQLSLFRPSMILTPTNRYGVSQAITLAVWPHLQPLLLGGLRRYRGIRVEDLGAAMAKQLLQPARGTERLEWDAIDALASS